MRAISTILALSLLGASVRCDGRGGGSCNNTVVRGLNETELLAIPALTYADPTRGCTNNSYAAGDVVRAAEIYGYPWQFVELAVAIEEYGMDLGSATINASAVLFANDSETGLPVATPLGESRPQVYTGAGDPGDPFCTFGMTFDLRDEPGFVASSPADGGGYWIGVRYAVCGEDVPMWPALVSSARLLSPNCYRQFPKYKTWHFGGRTGENDTVAISTSGRIACPPPPPSSSSSAAPSSSSSSLDEQISSTPPPSSSSFSSSSTSSAATGESSSHADSQPSSSSSQPNSAAPPSSSGSHSSRSVPSRSSSSLSPSSGIPDSRSESAPGSSLSEDRGNGSSSSSAPPTSSSSSSSGSGRGSGAAVGGWKSLSVLARVLIVVTIGAVGLCSALGFVEFTRRRWRRRRRRRVPPDEESRLVALDACLDMPLPSHTANAMSDRQEMARPHAKDDAERVALMALGLSDEDGGGGEAFRTCNLAELLKIEPRHPCVTGGLNSAGGLDVDSPEMATLSLNVANATADSQVQFCIVGFGGRAFVVGVRTVVVAATAATDGAGAERTSDRARRAGSLAPRESTRETIVLHARCWTMAKPKLLVLAVAPAKRLRGIDVVKIDAPVMRHLKLDPDEIAIDRKVGEGSYGYVYHGVWRGTKEVAVKKFKAGYSEQDLCEITKEAGLLAGLKNEYIVSLEGLIVDEMSMVSEFCALGSLDAMLKMEPVPYFVNFKLRLRFALDIARGMSFLVNDSRVLHRDLKPGNVLVTATDPLAPAACCKLTDFGSARMIFDRNATNANQATKGVGTPIYAAPEVLDPPKGSRGPPYSEASEVYSYAMTIYCIFGSQEPFADDHTGLWSLTNEIINGRRPPLKTYERHVPEECVAELCAVTEGCWRPAPEERLRFAQVVATLTALRLST